MKLHEEWLFKASHDLESARILHQSKKELFDICAYHTQQCAEKAYKAFLVFKNQEIDKTHNLVFLLTQCASFDNDFEKYKEESIFLNPFSTQFRYPEGDLQPTKDEIEAAIDYAGKIYKFVQSKIKSLDKSCGSQIQ